jgi:outer membrane phospholipase A
MKLYEEMFKSDDRVLYFDADSIIFISKENHYEPELADYLGKFTNEIKCDYYIEEFVAGLKNYGYKLNNGQTSC